MCEKSYLSGVAIRRNWIPIIAHWSTLLQLVQFIFLSTQFNTYEDDEGAKRNSPDDNKRNASIYHSLPGRCDGETEVKEEDGNLHE